MIYSLLFFTFIKVKVENLKNQIYVKWLNFYKNEN